jgi:alpha-amylase
MSTKSKRAICLFFYVHQPFRLKTFRFFSIGADHDYYDDDYNKNIIKRAALDCYLPANEILMNTIKKYGPEFKVTFGISGTALEQLKKYAPRVIDGFRQLYETGNVEFVAEAYAHSLAMFAHKSEYKRQIEDHKRILENYLGCKPTALVNSNLIYSNETAGLAKQMGFKTILTEGAQQILGWKSSNYLYSSDIYPDVKLLLRNYQLSDDITFRFSKRDWSEWPLTADKFISWLNAINKNEQIINLFMDYGTFGIHQKAETGIFRFINTLVEKIIKSGKWNFNTVSQAAETIEPAATLNIPQSISWADQDRDISAWLGNDLQQEAYNSLYSVVDVMQTCTDSELLSDWNKLQTCDHFYYMSTKYFNDGVIHRFFSPYSSPYEAFVNYMNVLSDFLIRVHEYSDRRAQLVVQQNKYEHEYMETM